LNRSEGFGNRKDLTMKMKRFTYSLARLIGIAALLTALCGAMHAEVGLMLDEALRVGSSKWTGAGHSAVYLSGVCMASPVELRMCGPGENGVVLTNYASFGEDHSYEWNAMPLNVYLYGVEDESARPLYASQSARWLLQERYREKHMGELCTGSCATNANALWRESVAATFIRDIYMFSLKTTTEQDRALVDKFNRAANVDHFNGVTRNCADFAREVVNTYFPGAAKADHVNDFWITTPKAIAKSFAHYGAKHPELEFHVVRFSQIPGEYPVSKDNRKGTEELFRANKWRVPLAMLRPYELMVVATSYMITGRFNPELELQRRPTEEVAALQTELREARATGDRDREAECKQELRSVRATALGTREEWSGYGANVRQYEAEAIAQGYSSDLESLRKLARHTVSTSWIKMDERGGLWLSPRDGRSEAKVGLSANTLTDSSSNAKMGYLLALSRVDAELHKTPKNRETLEFFLKDWALMEHLRGRVVPVVAGTRPTDGGGAAQ
jgi:hypothetical protein